MPGISRGVTPISASLWRCCVCRSSSAVTAGAEFTGPIDVCEYDVAGAYLDEPLEVVKAETVDIPVPAFAEVVIEGVIDPRKMDMDGPFAEWTGYYGERSECYIIQITGMTMRRNAIYHDLTAGCWEHLC
jgi:UbiD family decarboxylase